MANYLSGSRTEYTRGFGGFRGVDFSSEHNQVEQGRFTHLQNMWRDYESGQGDAIETIPGYRVLANFEGRINGIFRYRTRKGQDFVVVHAGERLHRFLHGDRDALTDKVTSFDGMADARSSAFIFADKLYILDGVHYYRLDEEGLCTVSDVAYVPTTYMDGVEYEQRNMLTDRAIETTTCTKSPELQKGVALYCDVGRVNRLLVGEGTEILRVRQDYMNEASPSSTVRIIVLGGGNAYAERGDEDGEKFFHINESDQYFFDQYPNVTDIYFNGSIYVWKIAEGMFTEKVTLHVNQDYDTSEYYNNFAAERECGLTLYGKTRKVISVKSNKEVIPYNVIFESVTEDGEEHLYATKVVVSGEYADAQIEVEVECEPSSFKSTGEYLDFFTGNPEYEGTTKDAINRCTVQCHFDGRLFFAGNPALPNTIFYTQRDLTGYNNPAYVGMLNYMNDGVGNTPNTAMAAASGMLMVFKADTAQDGSVYYHTGADTGYNLVPRIYPSTAGVPGIGCLGAAVNFYDDVCFLSRRGLEAIGKQTVNLERTVEHRSSNVDKRLTAEDLGAARFAEWKGYLVILCGSRAYLADSRQIFTHSTGVAQYEWYYMDDLCSYAEERKVFAGTEELPWITVGSELVCLDEFCFPDGARLLPCGNTDVIDRERETVYDGDITYTGAAGHLSVHAYFVDRDGVPYYVEPTGEVQGLGDPSPASALASVEDVLYIGMEDGTLVCMNTDKRGQSYTLAKDDEGEDIAAEVESDQIYRLWYTHAGRRYLSGFATAADNAGYPHLLKSTVKKSMVLKMKSLSGGGFRVMSRADRTEWRQVQRTGGTVAQVITSDVRGFDDVDFGAVNYNGMGGITVPIMEKEKKWVEKQLYLYSDGYAQPFGIFSLAYRFYLTGRIKK